MGMRAIDFRLDGKFLPASGHDREPGFDRTGGDWVLTASGRRSPWTGCDSLVPSWFTPGGLNMLRG